jgi:hypothetical protein
MTSLRCKRSWLALWAILLSPALAFGVSVPDLYDAAQPVESSQDAAFAEALKTVLVRVSGQRDAPARLGAALGNPRQFVQRFGVTADNVLEVGFDDVSIDQLLLDAGLPIWGRERPLTLVVLKLEELGGGWSSAESPPLDQARIANAARARGVPLMWASIDAQDQSLLSAAVGSSSGLLQIAQRYGANAILLGEGRRDASIRWTLASPDGVAQAGGALEDGAHLAADTFAQVFATAGSSLIHVSIEVAGISDLHAYAATTNYLEGMTLVRHLAVEQVVGDTVRFRLAVRGDAATLRRAIALDDRLVSLASVGSDPADMATDAGGRLAFRYQP